MEPGHYSRQGSQGRLLRCAAVLVLVLSAAACSVASLSPSLGGAASATASDKAATRSAAATDATGDTPSPSKALGSSSPTPLLTTGSLPSLGAAPAGTWTALDWIAIPGGHSPTLPTAVDPLSVPNVVLEGWGNGYVEFVWDSHLRTITPWTSADGLTWHAGPTMDTSVWDSEFKTYDTQYANTGDHDACSLAVSEFDEGPATLLVRGYFACGGGCGGPWYTSSSAIWTSSDALAWTALDVPKTFGSSSLGPISGGSSGFVSLGSSGSSHTLWLSSNGRTWTSGTLPADLRKSTSEVSDPASFADGFVLPGVLLAHAGDAPTGGSGAGCVIGEGPANPPLYRGGLWFSADGRAWVRDSLTGTTDAASVTMAVVRIDDHTLLATQDSYAANVRGVTSADWISTDGRRWTPVRGLSAYGGTPISDGLRGLLRDCTGSDTATQGAWPSLCVVGPKLDLVQLRQTGDLPSIPNAQIVLGPTGVLVTQDGSGFWIGVPTAN
jgi:hypothetical protein